MSPAAPMTVRAARAIHRALLILVPADVRRRYRAEMVATFETASAEAGARGVGALARLLCAEVRDLATSRRANRPAPVILETSGRHTSESPSPWLQPLAWRQAWRSLKRRPAYLAATVLTLGAGAGITTAVFSLVDTVLIKPLPYPDADRLVTVFESYDTEALAERHHHVRVINRLTIPVVRVEGHDAVVETLGEFFQRLDVRARR